MADLLGTCLHLFVSYMVGKFLAEAIGEVLLERDRRNRERIHPTWQAMRDKLIEEGSATTRMQVRFARPGRFDGPPLPPGTRILPPNVHVLRVPKDDDPEPPDAA
jgi:hypothetical protein